MKTKTDSQTDEGKGVAIIDTIIVLCKELSNYTAVLTPAMKEARKDLHCKIREYELESYFHVLSEEDIENRKLINKVVEQIKTNKIKIEL